MLDLLLPIIGQPTAAMVRAHAGLMCIVSGESQSTGIAFARTILDAMGCLCYRASCERRCPSWWAWFIWHVSHGRTM